MRAGSRAVAFEALARGDLVAHYRPDGLVVLEGERVDAAGLLTDTRDLAFQAFEFGFLVAAEGELVEQALETEGDLDEGGDVRVEFLRGLLVGIEGVHLAGTGVEGEMGVEQPADDGPFARVLEVLGVDDLMDEGQPTGFLVGFTQPERPGWYADGLQETGALSARGRGREGGGGQGREPFLAEEGDVFAAGVVTGGDAGGVVGGVCASAGSAATMVTAAAKGMEKRVMRLTARSFSGHCVCNGTRYRSAAARMRLDTPGLQP